MGTEATNVIVSGNGERIGARGAEEGMKEVASVGKGSQNRVAVDPPRSFGGGTQTRGRAGIVPGHAHRMVAADGYHDD
jgi:hypothetical protein